MRSTGNPDLEATLQYLEAIAAKIAGGGGGGSAFTITNIAFAQSPFAAHPLQMLVVDSSGGNIVINLPTMIKGQWVAVQQDQSTSLAVHTITVNAPGGQQLALPAPNNTAFAGSFVFSGVETQGALLTWFNGGASNGALLVR